MTLNIKNPHTVADDHGDPEELLTNLAAAEAENQRAIASSSITASKASCVQRSGESANAATGWRSAC